jgi:hypothetical protein
MDLKDIKIGHYYIAHYTRKTTQIVKLMELLYDEGFYYIAEIMQSTVHLPYLTRKDIAIYYDHEIEREIPEDMLLIEKCRLEEQK